MEWRSCMAATSWLSNIMIHVCKELPAVAT